ncbi:MAG: Smr/MutS family protein [Parvularculaceae bacterium]
MKRRIGEDEAALLARAMADVKPLRRTAKRKRRAVKREATPAVKADAPSAAQSPSTPRAPARTGAGLTKGAPAPPKERETPAASRPPSARPSAFAAGDPKIEKKARRGQIEIERTLDLHGHRQEAAHARLNRFIEAAYKDDCRCVLVVTGKGGPHDALALLSGPSPRGVIRTRFLQWIEEPPLRARVARASKAAPRHGGAGAVYLFLKRRK